VSIAACLWVGSALGLILFGVVYTGYALICGDRPARVAIAAEPPALSPEMLEAMREVDALLPESPPIAPSVTWPALAAEYGSSAQRWMKFADQLENENEQLENENRSHQRRG
jgi:hypothetical protein